MDCFATKQKRRISVKIYGPFQLHICNPVFEHTNGLADLDLVVHNTQRNHSEVAGRYPHSASLWLQRAQLH